MPHIILLGTCDTKLHELLYLRSRILDAGATVTLLDVGRSPTQHESITVSQSTLATSYGPDSVNSTQDLSELSRAEVIKHMTTCATNYVRQAYQNSRHPSSKDNSQQEKNQQPIHGIISAGGTGGTSLASGVMREALPLGFPKLIVSTNASSDVSPVVGETDITMMPSIVDVAGSNELLRRILSNAAGAIVGMAAAYEKDAPFSSSSGGWSSDPGTETASKKKKRRKRIGLTMFGVTTPCCDAIRSHLDSHYNNNSDDDDDDSATEILVFHCTGAGGRAMERLVREDGLDAVCDVTTTEICDYIAGGTMSAGARRLEAALERGIPYLISLGATDMVNFGPRESVPERYGNRMLLEHNPTITLMRTSVEEGRRIGEFVVEKIRRFARDEAAVKVVLPLGGVSAIATRGGPFYDQEADEALFGSVREGLKGTKVEVVEDERAINDEGFAVDVAKRLARMMDL